MSTGPRLLCNARKGRHRLPLGSRTHGCPTGRVCVSSADGGARIDDLATQSADDALVALLAKLDDYRGDSRFTTWAYKFALLEAAVKLRRRAWQGREVPVEADGLSHLGGEDARADHTAETAELLHELGAAIDSTLTPHQRDVLVSLTLNGVPIDVLAAHLNTTRGALYKTLHDARRKLRADASGQGPRAGLPIGRMNDVGDKELRMILGTPGPDVGCDACFDQLDRYVEAEVAGKDADALVPGMRVHLEGCPACREEHESLLALVQQEADDDTPSP